MISVLNAIQEFNKVDDYFADGAILAKTVDATTIKHITVRPRDTRPQAARTSTVHVFE